MVCDFIHAHYVQGSENYFQIIRFQKRLMVQVVKSAKKMKLIIHVLAYLGERVPAYMTFRYIIYFGSVSFL